MNNSNSFDDHSLFSRIAAGDENAFRDVVHYYSPKLISFIFSITKTRHTAEEIVQEVFLKLWQKKAEIEIDNLGGWLHKVASNMAYTFLRREALEGRLLSSLKNKPLDLRSHIDHEIDYKESNELIHKAISQLPEQQRRVYELSRQEGRSRQEIAEIMDISPNTVKNHQAKALQFIKKFFGQLSIIFSVIF